VHLAEVARQERQMTVLLGQPCLGPGDRPGQPLTVAERNEPVLPALQQQHRRADVAEVEFPWAAQGDVVVPPPVRGLPEPGVRRVDEVLTELTRHLGGVDR
jgi:hypothetical protein